MSEYGEKSNPLRNEVFPRVFDEHWAAVRHHVEGVLGDEEAVTEIVSEVFLHAWTRLRTSRPPSRVWLLRIADRYLRSHCCRSSMPHSALDAVHRGVSGTAGQTGYQVRVDVVRALGVLTHAHRRIITLTYWDGLAVGEIAELLRASESRVRKTLDRAQSRLRAELGLEEPPRTGARIGGRSLAGSQHSTSAGRSLLHGSSTTSTRNAPRSFD